MKIVNAKNLNPLILPLLPVALLTLTSCSSTVMSPPPVGSGRITYTKGVPGGEIVQTAETTAIVSRIDPAKRLVTLRAPDRNEFTVTAGREVVNLEQIGVADQVIATVVEKLVASLDQEGTNSDGLTTEVVAIDSSKRTATLRFEDGTTRTFPIRDDLDLSRHKVGEKVVFRFTERIAIKIEKLPK
jgi:hypothetical protein